MIVARREGLEPPTARSVAERSHNSDDHWSRCRRSGKFGGKVERSPARKIIDRIIDRIVAQQSEHPGSASDFTINPEQSNQHRLTAHGPVPSHADLALCGCWHAASAVRRPRW
jgi:hypothetical protein